jgi:quercetin dioxygenase-like cupin family protein
LNDDAKHQLVNESEVIRNQVFDMIFDYLDRRVIYWDRPEIATTQRSNRLPCRQLGSPCSVILHEREDPMFNSNDESGFNDVLDGIRLKTLVYGEKTVMTEFRLEKGSDLPLHSHPHEQTGYLVKGHLRLLIGGQTFDVRPGDSWCIAGGTEHRAQILADSVVIEVFSPPREDYLPAT